MGYVFYSLQTTGPDFYLDQIVRLIAVHTDHEFAEIERLDVQCQTGNIVPSPAFLVADPVCRMHCRSPNHNRTMK
jgi:exonuclease I